jgi:hypothetical protein
MGRDLAQHYRRRRRGGGRGTGGVWRSAWPELRRPSTQAGAARTPAPAAHLDRVSGIHPGYSCKEGGRVEDRLLLEFPCTPTRTRFV